MNTVINRIVNRPVDMGQVEIADDDSCMVMMSETFDERFE